MTAHPIATRPSARRSPQWVRSARWQASIQAYLAAFFLGFVVLVGPLALWIIGTRVEILVSGVQFVQQGVIWFPFSISIVIVASLLTVHVANGMTRRSFTLGALAAAVSTGLGYAGAITALLLIERAAYDRLGWTHGLIGDDNPGLVFAGGVWTHLWGLALICVSATVAGLLVAVAYYRWGGWWGTLALPLTLSPILLTSLLALARGIQFTPFEVLTLSGTWPDVVRALLALASIALGALGVHLITRSIPIARKDI